MISRTRVLAVLVALAASLSAVRVWTQTPVLAPSDRPMPAGSGTVTGIVVTPEGTRIIGAQLRLTNDRAETRDVTSRTDGTFIFSNVPAGTFELVATTPEFLTAYYGQTQPGRPGTPLVLADQQIMRDVTLTLVRCGVISGVVFDPSGQPAWGATVRVMRRTSRPLGAMLTAVENAVERVDDRGQYRIHGLTPGEYVVLAVPRRDMTGDAKERLIETSYPAAPFAELATPIAIGPAEERSGVDIRLLNSPIVKIAGRVTGARAPASVWITTADTTVNAPISFKTTAADGTFVFENLVPGRYRLGASDVWPELTNVGTSQAAATTIDRQWASVEVTAGPDGLTDLTLPLARGPFLRGRVVFQSASSAVPQRMPTVRLFPWPGSIVLPVMVDLFVRPDAAGRFTIGSVPPGRYDLDINPIPGGWRVKSAMIDGRDALDTVLDMSSDVSDLVVTITDAQTSILGKLLNAPRSPAAYAVIAFPAEPQYWAPPWRRVTSSMASARGFRIEGLPAGRYLLAVVEDMERGRWYDARVLESLRAGATPVTLADGQQVTQDLRVK